MSLLNRDQILAAPPLVCEDVEVPEWGGTVRVREMTAGEQQAYSRLLLNEQDRLDLTDYEAKLLTCTVCDEVGELLFAPGDVVALTRLAAEPVGRLWKVAARLNYLVAGELEKLGKELAAPGGSSSSASPASSDEPSESSSAP